MGCKRHTYHNFSFLEVVHPKKRYRRKKNRFSYDQDGNLTSDKNKNITSILYNYLNLPRVIKFNNSNSKKIKYYYDALGIKLRKVVKDGSTVTTTDYANGYAYENNILQFFPTSQGYVTPEGNGFKYIYQYKDQVGNVRLSYSDADGNGTVTQSEIIKESNYYPFGLLHEGYNSNVSASGNSTAQTFQYNSKELEESFDLDTYDLGARHMDPAIGRFWQIDPLADITNYQSPYVLADDNPILNVDVYGLQSQPPRSWLGRLISNLFGRRNRAGNRSGSGRGTKVNRGILKGKSLFTRRGDRKIRKNARRERRRRSRNGSSSPSSNPDGSVATNSKVSPLDIGISGVNPFNVGSGVENSNIQEVNMPIPGPIRPIDVEPGSTVFKPSVLNFGTLNLEQFSSGSTIIGINTRLGTDPATQMSLMQIANTLLLDPKVRMRITFQSPEADPDNTGLILTPTNTRIVRIWNKIKHRRLALYLYRQFGINPSRITYSEQGLGGQLIFSKKK